MFYSSDLLSKKSPLGAIWMVAHGKKVPRQKIMQVDVPGACEQITHPEAPHALRLQAILANGVVVVFARQSEYLRTDAEAAVRRVAEAEGAAGGGAAAAGGGAYTLAHAAAKPGDINLDTSLDAALFGRAGGDEPEASEWGAPGRGAGAGRVDSDLFLMPSVPEAGGRARGAAATPSAALGGYRPGGGGSPPAYYGDGAPPPQDQHLQMDFETFEAPDPALLAAGGIDPAHWATCNYADDQQPPPAAAEEGPEAPAAPAPGGGRRAGGRRKPPVVDAVLTVPADVFRGWITDRSAVTTRRGMRAGGRGAAAAAAAVEGKAARPGEWLAAGPATGGWPAELRAAYDRALGGGGAALPPRGRRAGKRGRAAGSDGDSDGDGAAARRAKAFGAGGAADEELRRQPDAGDQQQYYAYPAYDDPAAYCNLDYNLDGPGADGKALDAGWRRSAGAAPGDSGLTDDVEVERLRAALAGTPGAAGGGGFVAPYGATPRPGGGGAPGELSSERDLSSEGGPRSGSRRGSELLAVPEGADLGAALPAVGEDGELLLAAPGDGRARTRRSARAVAAAAALPGSTGLSQFELLEESGPGLPSLPLGSAAPFIGRATAGVLDVLRARMAGAPAGAPLSLHALTAPLSRGEAARLFYHALVLAGGRVVRAEQAAPYGDILITPGEFF